MKRLFDPRWNKPQFKALTNCKSQAVEAAIAHFQSDLNFPPYHAGILARELTSQVIASMQTKISVEDPDIIVLPEDVVDVVVLATQKQAHLIGTDGLAKIISDEEIRADKERYDF